MTSLTSDECHQLATVRCSCIYITLGGGTIDNMRLSQIMAENRSFLPTPPEFNAIVRGGLHRNVAIMFAVQQLEWCGYPMVKKFEEHDGQTDTA